MIDYDLFWRCVLPINKKAKIQYLITLTSSQETVTLKVQSIDLIILYIQFNYFCAQL